MNSWFQRNYKAIITSAFLVPIITVAIVSISHVTKWYGISNPTSWAIYLSVGIEIAALSSLAAISVDMGRKVYFPFIIATLIQFIGNIFFSYSFIDINGEMFKSWVELVSPLLNLIGVEPTDLAGHKRFLAFFAGGMLPIISLSFLRMLIIFTEDGRKNEENGVNAVIDDGGISDFIQNNKKENEVNNSILMSELTKIRLTEEELGAIEKRLLSKTPVTKGQPPIIDSIDDIIPEEKKIKNTDIPSIAREDELSKDAEMNTANERVYPALSDEEINEMFMDEYENKHNMEDEETDDVYKMNQIEPDDVVEEIPENIDPLIENEKEDTDPKLDETSIFETPEESVIPPEEDEKKKK